MSLLVEDLDRVVADACESLRAVAGLDWDVFPDRSDWSCRGIVEHVSDDLFAYAAALAPVTPETARDIPLLRPPVRHGDEQTIHTDPAAGNEGVVQVLDVCGGLLSAVCRTRTPDARGWHPFGISDADGFAAMGTVETVLHLDDVAGALGFAWSPAPDVVRRLLQRLFPAEPTDGDPWLALLEVTGRGEREVGQWQWDGTVR